ncbi:ATP-binding cassette domain-containing protein [Bifidobacterium callitrichos]|uniref:ATP-binding cassette domain-containing protein n=1 Tax=Bifidobacterium callitrichos TaxID=762209 RepID=A0A5M9ZBE7_9BIFI|nr:energy-coupling factor transporter ATPase [Bifidobacterium callitrichos]KAA8815915.1 ATP-binding cassette domain-containing protein [Bifidobacterium callitrichos]
MTSYDPTSTADAASLSGIRFSYDGGATWALDGVDLVIRDGEYVALTGPNGSGKSTLARLVSGLTAPDAGEVTLLGQQVFGRTQTPAGIVFAPNPDAYRAARRGIGAVFQNPEDQIVTTVTQDDVAFGPENLGVPREEIGRRIDASLRDVGMEAYGSADPTRMSGGQQQRIAIADMLAMRPRMLVLDEPTAMLDPAARAEVLRILDSLHASGTTIVHVTHHRDEVLRANRVVRVEAGRIVFVSGSDSSGFSGDRSSVGGVRVSTRSRPLGQAYGRDTHTAHRSLESLESLASLASLASLESLDSLAMARSCVASAQSGDVAVAVSGVSFAYSPDSPAVLRDYSLTVARGETVAIMGSNGAGKSTLARLICALDKPDAGSITVDGIPVANARDAGRKPRMLRRADRRRLREVVGFVMQRPERQLFAETVAEDVAYGPRNQHLGESEVRERVDWALELLHIEHLADRSPLELSGGQQRLVAIAGVIACRPRVLVMDEPTASLDTEATARIHELVHTLHDQGVTTLIITHSEAEARELADRIVVMPSHGDNGNPPALAASDQNDGRRSLPLIARLDPRVKMVSFLAMMFTAFAINTPAQLLLGALAVASVVAAARIRPARLLRSVHMFLALFVVAGLLNIFFVRSGTILAQLGPIPITDDGVTVAVLYACRFALVIILGAVFLETTTPTSMTDAFGALLSPLQRLGMHTQEIALVMSLALRFLPTLGNEAKAIADAQAARGGSIETGSPAERIRAMVATIVPIFAGTLRHADNLSLALDARCYEEGARRTHWRVMRVAARDIAFLAFAAVYIAVLVTLGLLLPSI